MSDQIVSTNPKEIAALLMSALMYDNGVVNCYRPEQYSLEHVAKIAICVQVALEKNPNLEFTEEVIECLTAGEESEMQALIDHYESFKELSEALETYFNQM